MRLTIVICLNLLAILSIITASIEDSITIWSWGFLCWLLALVILLSTKEVDGDI